MRQVSQMSKEKMFVNFIKNTDFILFNYRTQHNAKKKKKYVENSILAKNSYIIIIILNTKKRRKKTKKREFVIENEMDVKNV